MTDTSPANFNDAWAAPLLKLAQPGIPPEIRLAALTAVLRFPIGRMAFAKVVQYGWDLLRTAPPGSRVSQDTITLAAAVPLMSVREKLRQIVDLPDDPDREAVAAALEEAGDPSRLHALLARAAEGDENSFRLLAYAPLEDFLASIADIPPCPPACRADTRFWRALALGRLRSFDALEAVFTPGAPVPETFLGSPWSAWERIAAIRPCPPHLEAALENLLRHIEDAGLNAALGDGLVRALQLTTWAVTGQVDAEGQPLPPAKAFGPVEAPSPLRTKQDLVALLTTHLAAAHPSYDDGQVAWLISRSPTERLIRETVVLVTEDRPLHESMRLLHILALAADCQSGCALSPFRGDSGGPWSLRGRVRLIDDRTKSLKQPLPPRPQTVAVPPLAIAPHDMPKMAKPKARRITIDTSHVEYERMAAPAADSAMDFDIRESTQAAPPNVDELPAMAGAEPPMASPEAAPISAQAIEENRKVRARILQGGIERLTFLAGAENTIRCWIGLPEADAAASSDKPIPGVAIPNEGLLLSVELIWNDQTDRKPMILPASRSARSGDCDLHIQIPDEERYVSADVVFRYQGRIFEAVKMEAAVLGPGDQTSPRDELRIRVQLSRREVIALKEAKPYAATLVFGETPRTADDEPPHELAPLGGKPTLRVFDDNGARNYAINPPEQAIENLNTNLFTTEKSLVRRRADTPGAEPRLDTNDEEVRILLRDMARFGTYLYNQLTTQGFKDPGDRIQLLSLDPDIVLPLEFVYDKGNPAEAARLCDGWHAALDSDTTVCPECSNTSTIDDDTGLTSVICPFGFWSIRKVIERLNPDTALSASAPQSDRRNLPPIDSVVFAASDKVPETERNGAWTTIKAHVGNAVLAHTWPEWRKAVKNHPRLLVALPHHDAEAVEDFIEIGNASLGPDFSRLRRGQITAAYINPDSRDPGPILLLLGCKTGAESELGYQQLVREFQRLKTAIVLGTLAQILGRHAAPLASELVEQLMSIKDMDMDFGTVMRHVRRNMLARGYLLGLCLVTVGDAEWRLTPVP